MWEAELLPHCLAMGIGYDEFWTLNPRKLNVIINGYRLKREIEDEQDWLLGGYVFQAVSVAMSNAFKKKNQKAQSYFEILDRQFLKHDNKKEMTEEEKQKRLDLLIAGLRIKQTNFELNHGK